MSYGQRYDDYQQLMLGKDLGQGVEWEDEEMEMERACYKMLLAVHQ